MGYYAIPLSLKQIMSNKKLDDEVEIRKSIHQNIRLILKTFTLSFRYDPSFGSILNRYHASTPPQGISERIWREKIREDIQKNIKRILQKYETRVDIKDVFIHLKRPQKKSSVATMNVSIEIIGKLTKSRGSTFHYPDSEIEDEAKSIFPLMIPVGNNKTR